MEISVNEKLRTILKEKRITFKEVHHAPATTCEASAAARNEDISIGGKTLLFKDHHQKFSMFVISAAKNVDSSKVRKILKSQKVRFATSEELINLAGVEKGALPPINEGLYPFDLYLDETILKNEKIAFNAGDLTISFILDLKDYLKLIRFQLASFASDETL